MPKPGIPTYELFTLIRFEALFTRDDTGAIIDPTDIALYIRDPQHVQEVLLYSEGAVKKESEGVYYYDLELARAGYWTYRFEGDGTVDISSPDTKIYVNHSSVKGSEWPTGAALAGVSKVAA